MYIFSLVIFIAMTCESLLDTLGYFGFALFAFTTLFLAVKAEQKRNGDDVKCDQYTSDRYAHNCQKTQK